MPICHFAFALFLSASQTGTPSARLGEHVQESRHSFDALHRLRSLREKTGATRWIARDLVGRAQREMTKGFAAGATTTQWHRYDGWHRVATSESASEKRFVFGRSLDELLLQESGDIQLAPTVSPLGSTMKLVNSAGSLADQFRYDAFGLPLAGNAKTFSNLFAGAIYDAKAKLYDLRHRHYDPKIGRFLSRDPLGQHADPFNLGNAYSYVGNNPLTRKDPLGLFTMGDPVGGSPPAPRSILGEMLGSDLNPAALAPADRAILFGLGSAPELFGPSSSMAEPIPAPMGAETPSSIDELQTGLDIAGMTEPFGAVADGANALIYALRGQWGNAGLSGLAFIPLLGWLAGGSKIASKADNFVDDIVEGPGIAKQCPEVSKLPSGSRGSSGVPPHRKGGLPEDGSPASSSGGSGGKKPPGKGTRGPGDEFGKIRRQLFEVEANLNQIVRLMTDFRRSFPSEYERLRRMFIDNFADLVRRYEVERILFDFGGTTLDAAKGVKQATKDLMKKIRKATLP